MALTGIIEREILKSGAFKEKLGDYAYAFARTESFDIDWLKGHHQPLITVETFEKVQARRNGITKLPLRKNIGDDFIMRGMAVCADCRVPLRSSWSTGHTKKTYAYRRSGS